MSALPISQPKTIEDLLALEAATGKRFEIVNDEFVEMSVSDRSSETNSAFNYYLFGYVTESKFGRVYDSEMMYALPKSMRKADVSVIRADRVPKTEVARFDGAPDIVVEVVSPSDEWNEVRAKTQEWLDAGAHIVWVASPIAGDVLVFRRGRDVRSVAEGQVLDGEDVLPGFAVEVSRLFPSRAESRQEMAQE